MDKMIFFKLGDDSFRMPKLVGAFLVVVAILLFFSAGAKMFESWDNVKTVNSCLGSAGNYTEAPAQFKECRDMAFNSFNFSIRPDQSTLTNKQMAIALIYPVAEMFFWLALLIFGLGIYKSSKIIIPIRQSVKEMKK